VAACLSLPAYRVRRLWRTAHCLAPAATGCLVPMLAIIQLTVNCEISIVLLALAIEALTCILFFSQLA